MSGHASGHAIFYVILTAEILVLVASVAALAGLLAWVEEPGRVIPGWLRRRQR